MNKPLNEQFLEKAKRMKAMAFTGKTYSKDPFDVERCEELEVMADEMIQLLTGATLEQINEALPFSPEYPTPKVDVRCIVFKDDKVLLIQEKVDNCWAPPGGWADIGYTPAQVVVKEVMEEAGLDVKVSRILAIYDKAAHPHPVDIHYIYKIYFACEIVGGELKAGIETLGADFFPLDQLPPLSTPRILEEHLLKFKEMIDQNIMTTDFDIP